MDLFLAESGGVFKAYIRSGGQSTGMDLYLAGGDGEMKRWSGEGELFKGVNILQSFYYCDDFTEKVIIPNCQKFMLDSGAFTFSLGNQPAQMGEYVERYIDFIIRNKVDLFFEMDVDGILPLKKIEEIRHHIEKKVNKQTIPVWHLERGWKYFERMCDEYDYVAIGGVAGNPNGKKIEKVFPQFIKTAHQKGCKIHGLGYTSVANLPKYHFDSVDSSSWVCGNRFGMVYKFDGKTMLTYKKDGARLADGKAVALHNFKEWVKYAKYAERKL